MLASVHDSLSSSSEDWSMTSFSFTMEQGTTKTSASFSSIYAPDIVAAFKDFMLGAGFIESSVIQAMYGVIEEYESLHPRKDNAEPSPID
jgi:hypothetical protein